jgi:hypothetical protein
MELSQAQEHKEWLEDALLYLSYSPNMNVFMNHLPFSQIIAVISRVKINVLFNLIETILLSFPR